MTQPRWFVAMLVLLCCPVLLAGDAVLVIDAQIETPVQLAIDDLQMAIQSRGLESNRSD
jgi:hypothetical protein